MIIVTGGAGFIGSNLVQALNQRGETNIIVVDNLTNAEKVKNLDGLSIADYIDKDDFRKHLDRGVSFGSVNAVLHEGACSDTMQTDGRYVMQNNYEYSKLLYQYCQQHKAQYIYASSASVYGAGSVFKESSKYEHSLNVYAYSKLLFDNYIRQQAKHDAQVVGLRYFNVYGKNEQHKERMASVAWHFYNQFKQQQKVRLFAGSQGYENGAQVRDFVYVDDVVKVNLYFLENPDAHGIFNVGTGSSRAFNDIALAVINNMQAPGVTNSITLQQATETGLIEYFTMPQALQGKYQSYTQADLENLRQAGYHEEFCSIEQGVASYIKLLNTSSQ